MPHTRRKGSTTFNTNTGVGHQNNNNGSGTQNVSPDGVQVNFVCDFNTGTSSNPFKSLWDAVAGVGASHTAEQQFERGECLEGTRERVLKAIHDWIASNSSENCSLPICWLSGPTGAGKSAIAMTVAKACEEKGLAASFFFFRSDLRRNNPSALVLAIAHGLVVNSLFTRVLINRRILKDPSILGARLEYQFRELLLNPSLRGRKWKRLLSKLSSAFKEPNLVIIDGLDECGDESTQRRILSAILSSYQRSPQFPLRFLICSRPEAWIQEAFEAEGLSRLSECIVLDDTFEPDRDIERYYLHEFQLIRKDRKYDRVQFPSPWPSTEDLRRLVQISSGQFVYAATTVRFVKLPHSNPMSHLQIILDYAPEDCSSQSFLATLDGLYRVILSVNPNRGKLLPILAAILILPPHAPPSPEFIELLFGLPAGDVDTTLWSLHSVLRVGGGDVAITMYHTSFTDFLHDPSRSREFYIDKVAYRGALACQWLHALAGQLTANPNIILYPGLSRLAPNVCSLFERWVDFCLIDEQPQKELLIERDNLFRSILSAIPYWEKLLTRLASDTLLPTCTPDSSQSKVLRDLILGPTSMEPLDRCQLLLPDLKAKPFFLEFLLDPSQEYHLDLPKYHDYIARRWISQLIPGNCPPESPDWAPSMLWEGWAEFCCGIERPSDELLSDLYNLDLMGFSILMALMNPGHIQILTMVAAPLKAILSWLLSRVDHPALPKVIDHFREGVEWQRVGFEEIPAEHQPSQSPHYRLDTLYHMILRCATPDHDNVRRIMAVIPGQSLHSPTSPTSIKLTLGLSSEDLDSTLQSMRPVLDIRSGSDNDLEIRLFHSSFGEYLADRARSRDFHLTQEHAITIARQWLGNLATYKVRTYESSQLYGKETFFFLTGWVWFCTVRISKPTLDLLEDLWNVDFASVYLPSEYNWESTFEGLASWVGNYHALGIKPNKAARDCTKAGDNKSHEAIGSYDNGQLGCGVEAHSCEMSKERDHLNLTEGLLRKIRNHPKHFHLEWLPDVPPRQDIVYWAVQKAASCNWRTRLDGSRPSHAGDVRLTDCRCHISGGNVSRDPRHIAYQDACAQLAGAFTSLFEELSRSGAEGAFSVTTELQNIFLNMVQSWLLKHCRCDMELLVLCQRFIGLANGCLSLRIDPEAREGGRKNMLEWLKTIPDRFAEEKNSLEARFLSLPWERWERNWRKWRDRRP
ncbi:hypothetical protein PM082_001972 [Marasmius tenuissimus]|nr:hypothetical protein PM082_001972 [Marasmius tenuissimus]